MLHPNQHKLDIVWMNELPKRYMPVSFNGGPGWGVYDRRECRFVDDEIYEMPEAALHELWTDA